VLYKYDYNVLFSERNVQNKNHVVVEVNGDAQHPPLPLLLLLLLLMQHLAADY